MKRAMAVSLICCSFTACKVPFTDVGAQFTLADAAWFEMEQTLFFFYRVEAIQGLGEKSQIEVSYTTDDRIQPWAPLKDLPAVHRHVSVDCGSKSVCGSYSLKVEKLPRDIRMRLRYHADGEVFLQAPDVLFDYVGVGTPHQHRSLLVYGVFDETNLHVQWRARHQFPNLRNAQVEELGLRRWFQVRTTGAENFSSDSKNPYSYGFAADCPNATVPLTFPLTETDERARWMDGTLPIATATLSGVCGVSQVRDATGLFQTAAVARKNPEVHAAFPVLRSPIQKNTEVGFIFKPCQRDISVPHLQMQTQRLLLAGAQTICLEDALMSGFATSVAGRFKQAIDVERAKGRDMVITVALHHDDKKGDVALALEQALEQVLAPELDKTSPRLSGAFVFDSYDRVISTASIKPQVLWCPSRLLDGSIFDDLDKIPDAAQRSCPLIPERPDLVLGPFKFNTLPILPTRDQYLTFTEKYGEAQAGKTLEIAFLSPQTTPISNNIRFGDFGVVTFFNNESFAAAPTDAFSYCATGQKIPNLFFRVELLNTPLPLETLPAVHQQAPQSSYFIGLGWDFPFLTELQFEAAVAGSASVFSLSVPFGFSGMQSKSFGSWVWKDSEFPMADVLAQCTRFCEHPTFDSAGVYNVQVDFRDGYAKQCYRPKYPKLGEGGFPLDP